MSLLSDIFFADFEDNRETGQGKRYSYETETTWAGKEVCSYINKGRAPNHP
jgi:hypothetical protein